MNANGRREIKKALNLLMGGLFLLVANDCLRLASSALTSLEGVEQVWEVIGFVSMIGVMAAGALFAFAGAKINTAGPEKRRKAAGAFAVCGGVLCLEPLFWRFVVEHVLWSVEIARVLSALNHAALLAGSAALADTLSTGRPRREVVGVVLGLCVAAFVAPILGRMLISANYGSPEFVVVMAVPTLASLGAALVALLASVLPATRSDLEGDEALHEPSDDVFGDTTLRGERGGVGNAIGNILIGALFLAGGASGELVLIGTDSSAAITVVGLVLIGLGIYRLVRNS